MSRNVWLSHFLLRNLRNVKSAMHQHMMEEMFLSANRPFFQSSMVMSLGSIDIEEYRQFANRMIEGQNRTIGQETFQRIYDFAGGITWYVQAILHGIYEHPDRIVDRQSVCSSQGYCIREVSQISTCTTFYSFPSPTSHKQHQDCPSHTGGQDACKSQCQRRLFC